MYWNLISVEKCISFMGMESKGCGMCLCGEKKGRLVI